MNYADGVIVWYWPLVSKLYSEAQNGSKGRPRSGDNRPLAPSIAFDCAQHSTRTVICVQRLPRW